MHHFEDPSLAWLSAGREFFESWLVEVASWCCLDTRRFKLDFSSADGERCQNYCRRNDMRASENLRAQGVSKIHLFQSW